jgi:DNA-binding NtrC family response regulator
MTNRTILVVDDDEDILEGLKEILENEGYTVDTARTGQEAIEKSKTRIYDLALLDIRLPDIEGVKLLTKIHESSQKTIKIMITGYPSLKNAVESMNLGANGYIIKPIDPEKLLAIVRERLKSRMQAEALTEKEVKEWIESRLEVKKQRIRSLAEKLQEMYEEKSQDK